MLPTRRCPRIRSAVRMRLPRLPRGRVKLPLRWAGVAVIAVALMGAIVVPGRASTLMVMPVPIDDDQAGEGPTMPQDSLAWSEDDLDVDEDNERTGLTYVFEAGLPEFPSRAVMRLEGVTTTVPQSSRFLWRPQLLTRFLPLP